MQSFTAFAFEEPLLYKVSMNMNLPFLFALFLMPALVASVSAFSIEEPVMCTMDAKQCPDGSFVSRQGPDCTFALCPNASNMQGEESLLLNMPSNVLDEDKIMTDRRMKLVEEGVVDWGVRDKRVLEAMKVVQRHFFVPEDRWHQAYENRPLPIGEGQTISQPYIVALMSELADIGPNERVLEIGTGSGYQAAVLSVLAREVYSIEYLAPLAVKATKVLKKLGFNNVTTKIGDGYKGWAEFAPFDAILVTAAIDHVPEPLIEQLSNGGRIVIPVGKQDINGQQLKVIMKDDVGKVLEHKVLPVRFVPFLGPNSNN
jgi:protein-L-isoaspartate(D-aspartate) O-methyltransferase